MRLAVLASGRGSNFEALCQAFQGSEWFPALLVCDRAGAPVLEKAAFWGVEALHLPFPPQAREEASERLHQALVERNIELIALAGFMKILPPRFVDRWKGRILNIHPSLLPRHPGMDAIRKTWETGDEFGGITIHLVDHGVDTGPILYQNTVLREPGDTLESFEEKIHRLEHWAYPKVLKSYGESLKQTRRSG